MVAFFSAKSETFTRQSFRHKGVHAHESTDGRCEFLQMQSNKLLSRNLFQWLIFQIVCFFPFLKSRDWRFSRLKVTGEKKFRVLLSSTVALDNTPCVQFAHPESELRNFARKLLF